VKYELNLTEKAVLTLSPDKNRALRFRDTKVDGLGLKIEPSGDKRYFWRRRAGGRIAWKTIGEVGVISLEQARQKASEYNSTLGKWKLDDQPGDDPFRAIRGITVETAVKEYADRHVKEHSESKDPETAAENVRWMLDKYLDDWKPRRLATIRHADVIDLHARVGKKYGRHTANRLVQMLRAAVNWAAEAGLHTGLNPATKVRLFREEKRARFLDGDELARLAAALNDKRTTTDLRDFVHLSLFTGARKSDVLSMAWRDVDPKRAAWSVPDPKGEPYVVALPTAAVDILNERYARQKASKLRVGAYVFPSHGESGHVVDLKKAWADLLKRAKLANLRQHDLRRTMGSWQAAGGASLLVIAKSLGHTAGSSATAIYGRLALDPVRASVEAATKAMTVAMQKQLAEAK